MVCSVVSEYLVDMVCFCAINRKPKLTIRERARIERVLKGWAKEWERSSYRLIRFPVLENVGVGRIPSRCLCLVLCITVFE